MRCPDNHYRPNLEHLEKRDMPATASLSGGYLYVTSTTPHEHITISESGGRLSVLNTPISVGKSKVSSIPDSQVSKVAVYAYGGGDIINLRPSAATTVVKPTYIDAAGGNNQVYGGSGSNYIVGAGGHNTLVGGPGTDYLVGGLTDTLTGGGGFDWYYRTFTAGVEFIGGEHVSDIRQGKAPSCQSDAALAEGVEQGVNFANNIHYLGNSTYDVSLYNGSHHERVTFNGWFNSDDPPPATPGEYWTILMYRARLEAFGINPNTNYSMSQWDAFNRSTHGRLYSVADALYAFTGRGANFTPMTGLAPQTMHNFIASGDLIVATTPGGGGINGTGIAYDHAYAVMNVYYQSGIWKVRLYNPWGFDTVGSHNLDALQGTPAKNDGFITLSWSQFVSSANFNGLTIAKANAAQTAYFRTLSGSRE